MEEHAQTTSVVNETQLSSSSLRRSSSRRLSNRSFARTSILTRHMQAKEGMKPASTKELEEAVTHPLATFSVQSLLTDSLINASGTPFVDVNSKDVVITSTDNSAVVRDMHRRIISIARSPPSSDHAVSPATKSVFVTSQSADFGIITDDEVPDLRPSAFISPPTSPPRSRHDLLSTPPTATLRKHSESSPSLLIHKSYPNDNSISKPRPSTANSILRTGNQSNEKRHRCDSSLSISFQPEEVVGIGFTDAALDYVNHDYDKDLRREEQVKSMQARQRLWSQRLGQSANKDYGLPADVFDLEADMCRATGKVGIDTGIRFLQAMSAHPEIYGDIRANRKGKSRRPKTAIGTRAPLSPHSYNTKGIQKSLSYDDA